MGKPGFPNPPSCGEAPGSLPQRGRAREGAAPSQRYPMFIAAMCAPRMTV